MVCQSCHTNGLQGLKTALTVTQREDAEDASEVVSKYVHRKAWEKRIEGFGLVLRHACAGSLLGEGWCSHVAEGWDTLACWSRVEAREGWKGAVWLAQRLRQCRSSAEK